MITLIAALSRNRVIGRDGALPWRLPEDSRHFRRTTLGKPVIMGRGNCDSIGKPLDQRLNIVLTRQTDFAAEGFTVVHTVEEALEAAKGNDEIMIIGGEDIYALFLPLADRMILTFVDEEVEGDRFFPAYDPAEWREIDSHDVPADERHAHAFRVVTLERR